MEVRGVTFAYGKNEVLRDISLKIAEGKITTVIGANGCGKSMLFSLMTKNLYPKSVQIFLRSRNINNLNLKEFAQKAAIVHQYNTVSDDITVEQLVSFGRTPHKKMMSVSSEEDERCIEWAMEVTNVTKYRHREVSRLSGGQKQRLALARAILHDSPVYIFDEATSNIDIESEEAILSQIRNLTKKKTVVMISHRLANVVDADKVYVMENGNVAESGTHKELLQKNGTYARLWKTQSALESYGKEAV